MKTTAEHRPAWGNTLAERLFAPVDVASLVLFRVVFGAALSWEACQYLTAGWIERRFVAPAVLFPFYGFTWLQPLPPAGMYLVFALLAGAALGVALGVRYRFCAVLLFVSFTYILLLDQTCFLNHYYLGCLIAGLMVFIPAHRGYSIDAVRRPPLGGPWVPAWSLWILRVQFGLVYFFGGIAKLNADWLRGEPMRMWLSEHAAFPLVGSWLVEPEAACVFAYGGLLLDLFLFPALLWRKTRPAAFLLAVFFHLMNSQLFTIGIFPWVMLAATTLYFPPDWPRRAIGVARRKEKQAKQRTGRRRAGDKDALRADHRLPSTAKRRWVLALLAIYLAVQCALPWRHFFLPGRTAWTSEGELFAWHMLLNQKIVTGTFYARDRNTGRTWEIDALNYLVRSRADHIGYERWQRMLRHPSSVVQFAKHVAERIRQSGLGEVSVHAEIFRSLNGRRPALWSDPNIDLTGQPHTLGAATWVMPLRVPLDDKLRVDPEFWTRHAWAHFRPGCRITVEYETELVDGSRHSFRQLEMLRSEVEGRSFLQQHAITPEGWGPPAVVLIRPTVSPAGLYVDPSGQRREQIELDGQTIDCLVTRWESDDRHGLGRQSLELWRAFDRNLAMRRLPTLDFDLALPPDVVRARYRVDRGWQSLTSTAEVQDWDVGEHIGDRPIRTFEERVTKDVKRFEHHVRTEIVRRLSPHVPGHVVWQQERVTEGSTTRRLSKRVVELELDAGNVN